MKEKTHILTAFSRIIRPVSFFCVSRFSALLLQQLKGILQRTKKKKKTLFQKLFVPGMSGVGEFFLSWNGGALWCL